AAFPAETSCSNSARSAGANATRYFSMAGFLSSRECAPKLRDGIPPTRQSKIDGPLERFSIECTMRPRREVEKTPRISVFPSPEGWYIESQTALNPAASFVLRNNALGTAERA